mgnify:CR=1 FL=1
MSKIQSALQMLKSDRSTFMAAIIQNFFGWLPDKTYLQLLYRFKMGHRLDLNHPKTFTEKIQWLKLYNRRPEYTLMVDKYAVKKYVADIIGEKYIIPTLGVWDKPEDIDWDALPNEFVLKTTHGGGSGGVVICKDKKTFDRNKAILTLRDSMNSDIYRSLREWPYKDVKKRVLAEKYMAPKDMVNNPIYDLSDYKFFCFNGEPKYCQVIRDRHSKESIDFYDMNWRHQEFVGLNPIASNGINPVPRPLLLDDMICICHKLSENMKFVRIDMYVIDNRIYFGEITFYPASGMGLFNPDKWNEELGNLISL